MRSNARPRFNIAEPSLCKGWPINPQAATAQAPVQPWPWGSSPYSRATHIQRGIALTGTIEPEGQIGPVGSIPDKIRAAAREGYRTVLVPSGQIHDPRWNLNRIGISAQCDSEGSRDDR